MMKGGIVAAFHILCHAIIEQLLRQMLTGWQPLSLMATLPASLWPILSV